MDLATIYAGACIVFGVAGGIAIWVAAICQSGLVWGGTVGLIPAWFGGMVVGAIWPLLIIACFIWHDAIRFWVLGQYEAR